jgi:hypothetical protein
MTNQDRTTNGAGPLYEHSAEGEAAAKEPVHIPGSSKPTGAEQAEENRENDPPA